MGNHENITSVLHEDRNFFPSAAFAACAHIDSLHAYERLWTAANADPQSFWAENAQKLLHWFQPWQEVFKEEPEYRFSWFDGGLLNASYNCLDRHLAENGDKEAILWEGEPGDRRTLTYRQLWAEVCKVATTFLSLGVTPKDVVTIYMPMVPELTITVLACARLGIMHNVVFAGFSSEALASRLEDAHSRFIVTADGVFRKGQALALKSTVDEALQTCPFVSHVLVYQRTHQPCAMQSGRDLWWHELVPQANPDCPAVPLPSEQPLFLLYTSGSTGKPKGILHTTAGYLLGATLSTKLVFDAKPSDVYWCTADCGWITGHTYGIYGPLSLGLTTLMYEGAPQTPHWGRFWELIERYRVTIFYTAPTAIRAFLTYGAEWPEKYDLGSLRLLGTVGEPINPKAWMWYRSVIGQDRCPIVDTWWQTETGGIMIAPLPGAVATKPGSATRPFFGIEPLIVDAAGTQVEANTGGYLVINKPWPSMLRTIFGDHTRYVQTYWQRFPGRYFTGDGARCDADGNFWIMGRVDDVLNVSGHRLSTMEIESALVSHASVTEAAVVGRPDDIKGEAICCFVTLQAGLQGDPELAQKLQAHVVQHIGPLARPDLIQFTAALPKTRSGKIMRRLLRDIARGKAVNGDTSTLENLHALEALQDAQNTP